METHNSREGIENELAYALTINENGTYEKNLETAKLYLFAYEKVVATEHHQELQKARHDWLREEIVKLEGMKKDEVKWQKAKYDVKSVDAVIYNRALQTIIDRYQSELDQPNPWECGKCKQEQTGQGEEIPKHHRSCKKRAELDQPNK